MTNSPASSPVPNLRVASASSPRGGNLAPSQAFSRGGHSLSKAELQRQYKERKRKAAGGAAAYNKAWNEKNRAKYLAHKAVEWAVRKGKMLKQPCCVCGQTNLVHAHHDDYSKRLDVMWLCPTHHRERHKELSAHRHLLTSETTGTAIPTGGKVIREERNHDHG